LEGRDSSAFFTKEDLMPDGKRVLVVLRTHARTPVDAALHPK
jgi:hypothetical protein